jgi:hypothetical protein
MARRRELLLGGFAAGFFAQPRELLVAERALLSLQQLARPVQIAGRPGLAPFRRPHTIVVQKLSSMTVVPLGMRGRVIGVCIVAGLLLMSAPASAGAHSHRQANRSCAPHGLPLLASDQHAEIYRAASGATYVCLRRTGHRTDLGHIGCPAGTPGVELAPELSDTAFAYCESHRESATIIVRSVTTGRVLHDFGLRVEVPRSTMLEWAEPLRLFVAPDGAVAWLQKDSFGNHDAGPPPPPGYDVYSVDSTGFHALSVNLPVEPRGMQLVGSDLTWIVGNESQSAHLE